MVCIQLAMSRCNNEFITNYSYLYTRIIYDRGALSYIYNNDKIDMNDFIFKHWSGEYSLARAYWVNGVLIGFLAYMIAAVAGAGLEELGGDRESKLPMLYFFLIVLNVWQTVGIFRSALRDGGYLDR